MNANNVETQDDALAFAGILAERDEELKESPFDNSLEYHQSFA